MQDCYVGDIGDFGKYGLLRALCYPPADEGERLQLGVNWYLVPSEPSTRDGQKTDYLLADVDRRSVGSCDPALFEGLRNLVLGGRRSVAAVREPMLFRCRLSGGSPRGEDAPPEVLEGER